LGIGDPRLPVPFLALGHFQKTDFLIDLASAGCYAVT